MSNKSVSARFFDLFGVQHDVEACGPLFTDDAAVYWNSAETSMGVEAYKQVGYGFLAGIGDLNCQVLSQVEEGDRVASRLLWTGTHTGVLNGIPPTGKTFQGYGMVIDRFVDGRIAQRWEIGDMLGMLQQFGVIPMPGA